MGENRRIFRDVEFDSNKAADADLLVDDVIARTEGVRVDLVAKKGEVCSASALELLQAPFLLLLDKLKVLVGLLGIHEGGRPGISLGVLAKNSFIEERNGVAVEIVVAGGMEWGGRRGFGFGGSGGGRGG